MTRHRTDAYPPWTWCEEDGRYILRESSVDGEVAKGEPIVEAHIPEWGWAIDEGTLTAIAAVPDLIIENNRLRNALKTLRNDFQMIIDGDDMSGMSDNELFTAMMETINRTEIF